MNDSASEYAQPPAPLLQRVPVNATGRDFFMGDLHGCIDHLHAALKAVGFQEERDRLFSVGDLVDRGPDSWAVIDLLISKPWFHAVLGNHEAMILARHQRIQVHRGPWSAWLRTSGGWLSQLDAEQTEQMLDTLSRLPLALEIPQRDGRVFGLIHAEIDDERGWQALAYLNQDEVFADDELQTLETGLLWRRSRAYVNAALEELKASPEKITSLLQRNVFWVSLTRRTRGIDLLIAGHTITQTHQPFAIENRLSIDTGAFRLEGSLTLVEPMANRYFQIRWALDGSGPMAKAYCRPLPTPMRAWDVRAFLRRQGIGYASRDEL